MHVEQVCKMTQTIPVFESTQSYTHPSFTVLAVIHLLQSEMYPAAAPLSFLSMFFFFSLPLPIYNLSRPHIRSFLFLVGLLVNPLWKHNEKDFKSSLLFLCLNCLENVCVIYVIAPQRHTCCNLHNYNRVTHKTDQQNQSQLSLSLLGHKHLLHLAAKPAH